jgi:hypothetical protein
VAVIKYAACLYSVKKTKKTEICGQVAVGRDRVGECAECGEIFAPNALKMVKKHIKSADQKKSKTKTAGAESNNQSPTNTTIPSHWFSEFKQSIPGNMDNTGEGEVRVRNPWEPHSDGAG